jgi:hypothetical protein
MCCNACRSGIEDGDKANELSASLVSAFEANDFTAVLDIINKCLQGLLADPSNQQYYLALIYTCKIKPALFCETQVMQSLVQYMLTESNTGTHSVANNLTVPVLASHLVYYTLQTQKATSDWPIDIVGAFLDDALGPRLWVDDDTLKPFVELITRAFPPISSTVIDLHSSETEEFFGAEAAVFSP